jgi:hypothetical protein
MVAFFKKKAGFALSLTVCFLLLSLLGVLNHELWRDEWQGWLIAKEATTWGQLLENQRYETGRSLLWAVSLFVVSRVLPGAIAMQVFHVCIAAVSVFLIARFSPFQSWQKVALTFSYFLFFEYAQISRDYGLSVVFILLFCVFFRQRRRNYWAIAVCLLGVSNTNFYALLIAFALGLTVILDWVGIVCKNKSWLSRFKPTITEKTTDQQVASQSGFLGFLLIWLAGMAIALYFMVPPNDGTIAPKPSAGFTWRHLASTLAILWKAYCPMPGLTYHFWNTNILDDGVAAVLSVGLVAVAIALFRRQPLILFLYALGTSEISWITYAQFPGTMRHWGYLFILFLTCLWLTQDSAATLPNCTSKNRVWRWLDRHKLTVLNLILSIQLVSGLFAYSMDFWFPFTAAKAAAQFIHQVPPQLDPLKIGDPDWAALPVAGYLGEALYYPASRNFGTFIKFNTQRRDRSPANLAEFVNEWQRSHPSQPLVLILNYALADHPEASLTNSPTEIGQFTQALLTDENYWIYYLSL